MFNIGLASIVALPMIGYFDEHEYKVIHGIVSATFFIGTVVYVNYYASMFWAHKENFPQQKNHIEWIRTIWTLMNIALGALALSLSVKKTVWVPVTEWILVFLIINFFAFVSFDTDYVETVEPVDKKD